MFLKCPFGTWASANRFTDTFTTDESVSYYQLSLWDICNPEGISDNNPPIYRRGTEPGCTRHVRNGHRIIPKGFPIVTADLSAVTDRGYSLWKEPDLLFKNSQTSLKKKAYFCRFNSD